MRFVGVFAMVVLCVAVAAGCGDGRVSAPRARTSAAGRRLTFSELVAKVRSGIIRIEVAGCGERGVGTGFLLGPRLIATVEHVVDGAQTITLRHNGAVVGSGAVIGSDAARDIALVRSDRVIPGYHFRLASRAPALGEDVAAFGFPLGLPLTVTRGTVSGLGRSIPINGIDRRSLVQTDAAVNPGNSGGPLMNDSGEVIGLVDLGTTQANGLAFAVSAHVAGPLLTAWKAAPQPISAPSCPAATLPTQQAAPPPSGSNAQTYTGQAFSILYPSNFTVTAAEVNKGSYVDTTIAGPSGSGFLIRVDENPSGGSGTVDAAAAPVLRSLRSQPGYQEISLRRTTFQGWDALRWEFEVPEHGALLRKVDLFFIDGNGREWAILTQARASIYGSVAGDFDSIRASFSEP